MLLHKIEPSDPINAPLNSLPDFQCLIAEVQKFSTIFSDIVDNRAVDSPMVRRLTAAFRVERGPVEHDGPTIFLFAAFQHFSGELCEEGVLVKKLFRHGKNPFKEAPVEAPRGRYFSPVLSQ